MWPETAQFDPPSPPQSTLRGSLVQPFAAAGQAKDLVHDTTSEAVNSTAPIGAATSQPSIKTLQDAASTSEQDAVVSSLAELFATAAHLAAARSTAAGSEPNSPTASTASTASTTSTESTTESEPQTERTFTAEYKHVDEV